MSPEAGNTFTFFTMTKWAEQTYQEYFFVVSLIIKTYASLGSGSAEMHGSATTVGESADVRYRMMKPFKRLIEG